MGVFSGGMPEQNYTAKSLQVCKRDYEGEINRLKTQIKAASNLLQAVDEYCDCSFGSGTCTFTLDGLIGGLTREIKSLNRNVEGIQEEWEREGK